MSAHQPEAAVETLAVLRQRETELYDSRRQIAEMRRELDDTNRGLIALYTELEDARLAEARLAAIVLSSADAVISMTPPHVIQTWNPGAQRMFGHIAAKIVGRRAEQLIPVESRKAFKETLRRVESGEHPMSYDTRWRRKDGTLLDVAVALSGMRDGEGTLIGFSIVARDITHQLTVQTELAAACADQEVMADRDRIARDLHDMVIQRVFGAALALQGTIGLISHSEATARIESVIDELDATIRELRGAIFDLRHPQQATSIQLLGLIGTAQGELGFAPTVSFDGPIDAAIPDQIAVHLLAVVQEALSNITRHAHASAVEVTLQIGTDLDLEVSDNGRGFGPTTRASGLANMRERAQALDGTCEVVSQPGAGTRIRWRIPLRRAWDSPRTP